MKILVCEDDEAILKIMQFKLKKELGAEVESASDGKKAIQALSARQDYDLIITDIHMPYHSGMEVIEYTRKDLKLEVPIIVLSAEGLDDTLEEAFELGADDFVSKPFSPQELIARVKKQMIRWKKS